jgi:hypothetical protein
MATAFKLEVKQDGEANLPRVITGSTFTFGWLKSDPRRRRGIREKARKIYCALPCGPRRTDGRTDARQHHCSVEGCCNSTVPYLGGLGFLLLFGLLGAA